MGRPKGGKNRHWSKEEKLRIVLRAINGYESTWDVSRSEKHFKWNVKWMA